MRYETKTVRVGELLGPVDWEYDFAATGWDQGGSGNPDLIEGKTRQLRELEAGLERGESWEATTDGGVPRVGWGRVLAVGMYDGWPYWKPTPSVLISGPFGGEWSSWWSVSEARALSEARS